jgi:MFS superfamily sulfate permease-like transporter
VAFTRYTGAVAVFAGVVTAAVPAFLLLTGQWADNVNRWAVILAVTEVASLIVFVPLRTRWTAPAQLPEGAPDVSGDLPTPRGSAADEARRSGEARLR